MIPAKLDFLMSNKSALIRGGVWSRILKFTSSTTNDILKAQCRDDDGVLLFEFDITVDSIDSKIVTMSIDKETLLDAPEGRFNWALMRNDNYIIRGELDIITGEVQ